MPADLHIHTTFSDGTQTPEKVVQLAKEAGLKTIAITDHDTVSGIISAPDIEIIPGIEFTTETDETEIHILGYYIDVNNARLLENIAKLQKGREERIIMICNKLADLGAKLDPEKIFALAGHRDAGRPHVAQAMIEAGIVKTFKEAFDTYIAFNGPAYVSHYKLSPVEAVELVTVASGLAVYAHPAVSNCDQIVPELKAAGLVGIEAQYPTHNKTKTLHYEKLAVEQGLLVTGGSDYHGFESGRAIKLGEFTISDELAEKLKNEHFHRN